MTPQRDTAGPVQERARRTRRALVLAAAETFAVKGYRAATTSDIAARAGTTKGALAFHFAAKGRIAAAIVEECYERWSALAEEIAARNPTALGAVEETLRMVAGQIRDDAVVRATVRLQAERTEVDVPLVQPYQGWIEAMTGWYSRGLAEGGIRAGLDPGVLARVTVGAFFGVQHVAAASGAAADVEERVMELWAVLKAGMQTAE